MFEEKIIELLSENSSVVDNLSTYGGVPAIFSDQAPEDADFRYIEFTIRSVSPPGSIIDRFLINLECYDYDENVENVRILVDNIFESLDNKNVSNNRYDSIRLRRDIYTPVPEVDPRAIHYHAQIEARATRKKWMSTI